MGAGPGLGVVLHAEHRGVLAPHTLDHPVVEVHMGDLRAGQRTLGHRIIVVLRCDLDPAGIDTPDWMVAAVVAEGQLVGGGPEGGGQQLMAEADPEDRDRARLDQRPDLGDDRRQGGGIPWSVGEEDPVGLHLQYRLGRGGGRYHGDGRQLAELAEHRLLHAEVVGHHPKGAVTSLVHRRRGHRGHQVPPVGAGSPGGRLHQFGLGSRPEGTWHRPPLAKVTGQAAGVDAGDPRDGVADEELFEGSRGPPAARAVDQVADDDPPAPGPGRLVVVGVHAVVADVGIGEGDDLPGVGRIGDDLLVPGQHRVEDGLPGGHPALGEGTDGLTLEPRPVGQHQQGLRAGRGAVPAAHRWASASMTTGSPRNTVWRTRPVSFRPA